MHTVIDPAKAAELYKQEWQASKEIQKEFGGNYESYAAYRKAEDAGQIGLNPSTKRRLSTLQTLEKISLEWQLTPSLREKFSDFDTYRAARWHEETGF
jgi:hypothetical protein